jgi:sulfate adenylyltransferase subunit 2
VLRRLSYLDELESESIYAIREAYAQFQKTVILFSGGKDSIVLTYLARKAFWPAPMPFALLHIDTGHNFKETIAFRDKLVLDNKYHLIVSHVQDSIDEGLIEEETGPLASRNRLQTTTLLQAIAENKIDACMGGARRDEEKARAKERFFSHRDVNGLWNPKNQRPELWNIFNGKKKQGESFRIFPISNWTEMDVWRYIQRENIQLPSLYFSHSRECFTRNGTLLSSNEFQTLSPSEQVKKCQVRFRTMGDITITGAIESTAANVDEVISELQISEYSERGGRADDQVSDSSMEDRKKEGYF